MKRKPRILIGCEFSGIVRDAFTALGHDAWSCDLLPTESDGQHIQGNILEVMTWGWDLLIAHPTCTYLANSGVRWLHKDESRWAKLDEGAAFFKACLDASIDMVAVENPIMHKYAVARVGRKHDQVIPPYMFGHAERKATCLWLKNLPLLAGTEDVKAQMQALPKREAQRLHYASPGPDRWKFRSRTFPGIAGAMADQWGRYALEFINNKQ